MIFPISIVPGKKVAGVFATTSVSSNFTVNVTNTGPTLSYELTGGVVASALADNPTFDLSTNTSTVYFDIVGVDKITYINLQFKNITSADLSGFSILEILSCSDNLSLTSIDLSNNPLLKYVYLTNTGISSIDLSNNPSILDLTLAGTNLTDLDLSNNTSIVSLNCRYSSLTQTALNQIFIDLDNNGLQPTINIDAVVKTSAGQIAFNNLIARGSTITEY